MSADVAGSRRLLQVVPSILSADFGRLREQVGEVLDAEATPHLAYATDLVREAGAGAGVAINPGTPAGALEDLAGEIDLALCMTVNPGWGGQRFIARSLQKIERVRAVVGGAVAVQVDGGIDPETAPGCRRAGANLFVAGSAIFASDDPGEAYRTLARSVAGA